MLRVIVDVERVSSRGRPNASDRPSVVVLSRRSAKLKIPFYNRRTSGGGIPVAYGNEPCHTFCRFHIVFVGRETKKETEPTKTVEKNAMKKWKKCPVLHPRIPKLDTLHTGLATLHVGESKEIKKKPFVRPIIGQQGQENDICENHGTLNVYNVGFLRITDSCRLTQIEQYRSQTNKLRMGSSYRHHPDIGNCRYFIGSRILLTCTITKCPR